jgi:hypothetical protein
VYIMLSDDENIIQSIYKRTDFKSPVEFDSFCRSISYQIEKERCCPLMTAF